MFDLVRCSRCNEPVRLPEGSTIWVRCPHCSSEYPLHQLLATLPPALEAIAPPSLVDSDGLAVGELADSHSVDVDTVSTAATGSHSPSGTTLVTKTRPQVVVSPPKQHIRTPDNLRAERKKQAVRRNRQANGGIVKVVLGGVAGLFLGQLILWWLPGQYRTDPMELAPKLPASLSFLAPASLRGDAVLLLPDDDNKGEASNASSDGDSQDSVEPSEAVANAEPLAPEPTGEPNAKASLLGSTDTPSFNIRELNESLAKAKAADAEISKSFDWELAALNRWYAPIRELAHCVTYANMAEPEIQEFATTTRTFVGKLATDQRKKVAIANLADIDLKNASHERTGIVVTGKIKSISKIGHFFNTELESPAKSGATVTVISRVDPRTKLDFTEGDEIVILGVVVADPKLYLLGYNGNEEAIVFGGLPYKVK